MRLVGGVLYIVAVRCVEVNLFCLSFKGNRGVARHVRDMCAICVRLAFGLLFDFEILIRTSWTVCIFTVFSFSLCLRIVARLARYAFEICAKMDDKEYESRSSISQERQVYIQQFNKLMTGFHLVGRCLA